MMIDLPGRQIPGQVEPMIVRNFLASGGVGVFTAEEFEFYLNPVGTFGSGYWDMEGGQNVGGEVG